MIATPHENVMAFWVFIVLFALGVAFMLFVLFNLFREGRKKRYVNGILTPVNAPNHRCRSCGFSASARQFEASSFVDGGPLLTRTFIQRCVCHGDTLLRTVVSIIASAVLCLSVSAFSQQPESGNSPAQSSGSNPTALSSSFPKQSKPAQHPSITGPLQAAPPITFDAGPLGKLSLNGVLSGFGLVQNNHVAGDDTGQAALSNGQLFVQKSDGWWQFYVQAGAYNILSLGLPFTPTGKQVDDLYSPVPVAYLKLVPAKSTSIQIGELPTLIGAEYTFDFENMNIERGLLWNQENAINRGIQINQTLGKFAASLSWNDGYYSNRYSWLSGSLTYAQGPHALTFVGMGNAGHTAYQTAATPVQNNSVMYELGYTYSKGNWIVQPYYQYTDVPTDLAIGIAKGASTQSGAVLLSHTLGHGFSLTGRGEYIASTGSASEGSVNLLYGPGSSAWSGTVTPTFQKQRFFVRGDVSFVHALSITAGNAFGETGADSSQTRGVLELGFLF